MRIDELWRKSIGSVRSTSWAQGWGHRLVLTSVVLALVVPLVLLTPVSYAPASGQFGKSLSVNSGPFRSTGFFYVTHRLGRWFFVTPTGQTFFSTGVDHVTSTPDTDQVTGQCLYCQTIQSEYSSTTAWESATVNQLRSWGFNSLGPFSDDSEFAGQMPYTVQLNMASGDDWFAPSFLTNAYKVAAAQVAPLAYDPNLIGWYTDSELTWGPDIENFNTELQDYLELPAGSPGLAVAQQYVGHPDQFLYALATRYFQVTTAAVRTYDPNHLLLGVKAEGQYIQPQLLEAARRYITVFSIDDYTLQPGFASGIDVLWPQYLPVTSNFANFEKYAGIPIMVAEYSVIGETAQTPDTVPGVYAVYPNQDARALAYDDYISPLYEHAPWVVGDEWFEYVDEPQGGRVADGENNNFGLVNVENDPYQELVDQMSIMHSIAPDRLVQSGSMCDAWSETPTGVGCTATMPDVAYPVTLFGTTLASGFQGQTYTGQIVAGGGRPPYTYTIVQGSLPVGLELHKGGDISGNPQTSGTFSVTIEVKDSTTPEPEIAQQTISLSIAPPN